MPSRIHHVMLLALLTECLTAGVACGGTKTVLGARHVADELVAYDNIDHSTWDALLRKYVDVNGMVDYAAWKGSPTDLTALDAYLSELGRANVSAKSSREAAIAFWCNAYNAVTIQGILQEYPTSSIRNHTAKMWGYNIWHDLLLQVGPQAYSLDTIEHQLLRKSGEHRIHFAIVCASIGCPRLLNEAYDGERLAEQLEQNTGDFFARAQNLQVHGSTLQVSEILKWYREDFGPTPEAGITGLQPYLPENARAVIATGRFQVEYLKYDWSLNDQARFRNARR